MYFLLSLFVAYACAIAPLIDEDHPERIDGSYIVVFHPTTDDVTQEKHRAVLGDKVIWKYNLTENFMGYNAKLTQEELDYVRRDPAVKEVALDREMHLFDNQQSCSDTQTSERSWGIVRVAKYGRYDQNVDRYYRWNPETAGSGVTVYIIDTGIRISHVEFGGRAKWGTNTVDTSNSDGNGHGTHCAGTAVGNTAGMARGASVVAVKVLNAQGSGTNAGVIAGIQWVRDYAVKPAVASMSLGGGKSAQTNAAVAGLVASGVTVVVAAGNDNRDACNYSPASEPTAITVASTDSYDYRSTFSNWGTCTDIFAPGSSIVSSVQTSDSAYATFSGTSMACPHVAGVAAIVLSANRNLTPAGVRSQLVSAGTKNSVVSPGTGSPNVVAYSGC